MTDPIVATDEPARAAVPRWWTITMGAITAVAVGICAAVLWVLVSDGSSAFLVLAVWALLAAGAAWLAAVLFCSWRYRSRGWRLRAVAPVVVCCTVVVGATGIPEKIGWAVSESALDRVAAECVRPDDGRAGVYRIRTVEKHRDGCLLYTDGGFINPVGFAHFPAAAPALGRPRHEGDIGYEHLDGPWYRFTVQF
ncbi:hypothetical protein [Nocardia mexicana]|uniref:DUF1109 domain-containing protein n=1 Tax=Nocardia mexicana TaxID=279262 RepID=A0A370H1V7_9NOCA|nr:hypothetical protein [Nocardia mexicana]RDI49999.1 hypothetical protein DFR68_106437 [Nocardia mexicana]